MQDDSSPGGSGGDFGNASALAKGTKLFEFEVERVLGEGGFAIVYLAFDHSLHRRVALKEYLPAELAFRQDENTIVLRSVQHQKTYEAGRSSFMEEARFLAQFEHPSLVKVHRVFESNGTAYMVQGYYAGQSLSAILKSGKRYGEDELRPIVASLLAAVELLHGRQCLHRDIAPDNIIIQPSGVPVLLDFGAARRIIGDMTQALTAVLKPSYAPIEQYTEDGGMAQGPWTDVYALAATLRAAITGKPPPSSVGRTIKDGLVKLADQPPPNFDPAFLRAVDAGLALLPADRPQSIAEFRSILGVAAHDETSPPVRQAPMRATRAPLPVTSVPPQAARVPPRVDAVPPSPLPRASAAEAPAPDMPRRGIKRGDAMLMIIAAAAVLLMLLVPFAADWLWPSPSSTPTPSRAARSDPPRATVSPPAPVAVNPAPASPAVPSPEVVPAPTPPSSPAVAVLATPTVKEPKPAASEKPVTSPPSAAPPALPKAAAVTPEPPPVPRQEPPAKPALREPPATAATSLIPVPSQPVPAPREEPPAKPAAVPPLLSAPVSAPEPARVRRALVRVTGEPPVYPREAIRSGIESGRIVATVTVDAQGNVTDVDIVRSEPPRVFDRSARAALAAWKFKPEGERLQGDVELLFNLRQ